MSRACFLQEWQIGYWFLEVITTLVATVDKLCVKEVVFCVERVVKLAV